jgi:hypothetical protein
MESTRSFTRHRIHEQLLIVFSVDQSGWSVSSLITDDVFSVLQCPFLRSDSNWDRVRSPNSYPLSVCNVNGDTICTALGQDLGFHVWKQVSQRQT